jgi:hypothetical protein
VAASLDKAVTVPRRSGSMPYCLGHRLSALGVITLFWNEGLLSLLLLWLLTTFLSGVVSGLLCWSLKEMESLKAKEEAMPKLKRFMIPRVAHCTNGC